MTADGSRESPVTLAQVAMRFELGAAEIQRHVRGRAARAAVRPRLQAVRRLAHMIESEKRQKRPRVTRGHAPRQVRGWSSAQTAGDHNELLAMIDSLEDGITADFSQAVDSLEQQQIKGLVRRWQTAAMQVCPVCF